MNRRKIIKGIVLTTLIGGIVLSVVAYTGMTFAEPKHSKSTGNGEEKKVYVLSEFDIAMANIIQIKVDAIKKEKIEKKQNETQKTEKTNTETNSVETSNENTSTTVTKVNTEQSLPGGEDGNMIRLINQARAENGLGQLTYDSNLYALADVRLNEIAQSFSHNRPDGTPFYTLSGSLDGENLSRYGAGDAQSSFTGFMNSADHRSNILYSGFTRVACKVAVINGNVYWVQLFGY